MVKLETFDRKPPRVPGKSRKKVICLACGGEGVFTPTGPNGVSAWLCQRYPGCDSYVGVHPGTENALGTMANAQLRAERVKAHGWIDRLWRGKKTPTRKEVYQVVGQYLGLRHFHVAQSDMSLLARLAQSRADIERAFLPMAHPPPPPSPPKSLADHGQEVTVDAVDITSEIDRTLLEALFGDQTRRRWPVDAGGRAAATRGVQMGFAHSYLDGSGRRWISKVR